MGACRILAEFDLPSFRHGVHFNVMASVNFGSLTGFPIKVKGEGEASGGDR